ncbi:tetratricopeptide repeat protein [Rubritalea marina]|uniref:tetratricopeptide repeat protein n=1 Tax=Rubritalea marina TaxID=361055 RepID=UPI00036BB74F|nr:tetratricopeptide repeat protein [Rubritalea marina]
MRALYLALGILCLPAPLTAQVIVVEESTQESLQSDPAADYFARARQLYDAAASEPDPSQAIALYRRSIPILENYVSTYPRHKFAEPSRYYLANAYYAVGNRVLANNQLENLIQQYRSGPYVAAAAFRLGYERYNQKRYTKAARYFQLTRSNAEEESDKLRAAYFEAQCYLNLNDKLGAKALLELLATSELVTDHTTQAIQSLAHLHFSDQEFEEALKQYQSLLSKALPPEMRAEITFHAGATSTALEKYPEASKFYQEAIDLDLPPWKAKAYIGLLQQLYSQKQYDEIIATLNDSSVMLAPEQRAKQGFIVGQAYLQKKQYAESIAFFEEVERSVPNTETAFNAAYYKLKALYEINAKRTPKSVDQFIQKYAIGRGTNKFIHHALLMKAEVLYQENKFKEASETYSAISPEFISPSNRSAMLYKKAWSFMQSENNEGAINAFTQFMNEVPKDPKVPTAYAMRGQAHMNLGDRVKALKDLDKAIQRAPKTAVAARALQLSARVERNAKRYPDTISRLEQLLKDYPDFISAKSKANSQYWLGHCYYKLEQFDKAIPALRAARVSAKDSYDKQASIILMMMHYAQKDFATLKKEVTHLEELGLQDQIPLAVYRGLGSQAYQDKDYQAAATFLSKGCETGAPQKTPNTVWRLIVKSQMLSKQWQQANATAKTLVEVETEPAYQANALLTLGVTQLHLKQLDSALASAEKALAMRPSGETKAALLNLVGNIAYLSEDYEKASQHYVLVVESFDESAVHEEALYMLVQSLNKLDKDSSSYRNSLRLRYPGNQSPDWL